MSDLGIVIIGRNEGERLVRCLRPLCGRGHRVVYVDSGSGDDSVQNARAAGAEIVELDMSIPFTAARARNMGLERLRQLEPGLEVVQFVDGDCEMMDDWLEAARAALAANPRWAAVCGRLCERDRDRSIYNRLADMEWNVPPGDAKHCGGIAMYRLEPWITAGGFDPDVAAGEEPDLCLRLRRDGWVIHRLPIDMAWHDIAMTRFGQWWRRTVRSGFAYAQGMARAGGPPAERYGAHETRSFLFWGLILPLLILGLAWPTRGLSLIALLAYPLMIGRIFQSTRRRGLSSADAWLSGWACMLGKFAQVAGFLKYWSSRMRGSRSRLIEYKAPPPLSTGSSRPRA